MSKKENIGNSAETSSLACGDGFEKEGREREDPISDDLICGGIDRRVSLVRFHTFHSLSLWATVYITFFFFCSCVCVCGQDRLARDVDRYNREREYIFCEI